MAIPEKYHYFGKQPFRKSVGGMVPCPYSIRWQDNLIDNTSWLGAKKQINDKNIGRSLI